MMAARPSARRLSLTLLLLALAYQAQAATKLQRRLMAAAEVVETQFLEWHNHDESDTQTRKRLGDAFTAAAEEVVNLYTSKPLGKWRPSDALSAAFCAGKIASHLKTDYAGRGYSSEAESELAIPWYERAVEILEDAASKRPGETDASFDGSVEELQSIKEEFDQFAVTYDSSREAIESKFVTELVSLLSEAVRAAAGGAAPDSAWSSLTLDLGVGTGAFGPSLRAMTLGTLTGVDLSDKMVAKARARGVYDKLFVGELVAWFQEQQEKRRRRGQGPLQADLALAGELVLYFGDLQPLFTAVAGALSDGGWFAFNCESLEDILAANLGNGESGDHQVRPSMRHAHTFDYVERAARAAGFSVVASRKSVVLRMEFGKPELGHTVVLRKQAAAAAAAGGGGNEGEAGGEAGAGPSGGHLGGDDRAKQARALAKQAKRLLKRPQHGAGAVEEAEALLRRAFDLAGRASGGIANDLGVVLLRQPGKAAEAAAFFRTSLELRPRGSGAERTRRNLADAERLVRGGRQDDEL
eukprot:g4898.t1